MDLRRAMKHKKEKLQKRFYDTLKQGQDSNVYPDKQMDIMS